MKIAHRSDYAERRRKEYPPIADQLDSLWKVVDSLNLSDKQLGDAAPILAGIKSTKQRYPKS